MADYVLRSFVAIQAGGDYCGVSQHWSLTNPSAADSYSLCQAVGDVISEDASGASYCSKLAACLAEDASILSVRVQPEYGIVGASWIKLFDATIFPGTFNGHTEAGQVAGLVTWSTVGHGSLRTKSWIPAVATDALSKGRWHADYISAVGEWRDWVASQHACGGGQLQGTILSGPAPGNFLIKHGVLSPQPGTMRRRLRPY